MVLDFVQAVQTSVTLAAVQLLAQHAPMGST